MIPAADMAAMVGALAGDDGRAAAYSAGGGAPVPVVALVDVEEVAAPGGDLSVLVPQTVARVLVAEVPAPRRGDTLTVCGILYEVEGRAREAPGDMWRLTVREV